MNRYHSLYRKIGGSLRAAVSIISSSLGKGLSRVRRRVIRRYFRGIGFLHPIRLVGILYHIPMAIDEESLNRP